MLNFKRIFYLLQLVFSLSGPSFVQAQDSPDTSATNTGLDVNIYIYTPGNQVYSTFGHVALELKEKATNRSTVFNYGVFDFDTPNFLLKFIRGRLQYKLATEPFSAIKRSTARNEQDAYKYALNLSEEQQYELLELLKENYKPENRYYLYDFFYDNCATRIAYLIFDDLGYKSDFQLTNKDKSFRQLLYPFLEEKPWLHLGISIALGLPTDEKASFYGEMFLPRHLGRNLESAYVVDQGEERKLVTAKEKIYSFEAPLDNAFITPNVIAILLFLVALILVRIKNRPRLKSLFDGVLFAIVGLSGIILLLLWFATDHAATKWNFNVLWLNPITLLALVYLFKKEHKKTGNRYDLLFWIYLGSCLIYGITPQTFPQHTFLFLIALTVLLRLFDRSKKLKVKLLRSIT